MVDAVYAEITPPEPAGEDWRATLRSLAHRTRQAAHRHEQGQRASGPYITRMLATGRYPTLARAIHDGTHPDTDTTFDTGLDGIAARLGSQRR